MTPRTSLLVSVAALLTLYVGLHFWLPPAGFFCGDQGPKYLQARAIVDHGLFAPWIDGPFHDLDPQFRYIPPATMRRSDNHVVSVFTWLLPVLTAPLLATLGLHGLYVIPALSTIVIFVAARSLGRKLGVGSGLWSAWAAVAATPVLFYGAEFWDHAPAVAAIMIAANLLAPDAPLTWRGSLEAGICLAIGGLFREEALLAAPALLIARAFATIRDAPRDLVRRELTTLAGVSAGMAIVFVLSLPMNWIMYGAASPYHLLSEMAKSAPYFVQRADAIHFMLLPSSAGAVLAALLALAVAVALIKPAVGTRLVAAHVCVVGLIMVAAVLPLWRSGFGGMATYFAYRVSSAAHTWPFWIALVYVALLPRVDSPNRLVPYLAFASGIFVAIAIAVTPSNGGAQWGPRYLLPAAPLLAVLAPLAQAPVFRLNPARAREVRWIARAVIAISVLIQINGLVYLIDAKRINARITRTTAQLAPPGDVIITDLGWYPQLIATLYDTRRPLLARTREQVGDIVSAAAQSGFERVAIVICFPETGYMPPPIFRSPETGAELYRQAGVVQFADRALQLHRFVRASGIGGQGSGAVTRASR